MAFKIQKLPNEPVVLATMEVDFNMIRDSEAAIAETVAILDASPEPLVYISDTSNVTFSYDETVEGTNAVARGENPLFHHPNIRQVLMVVGNVMQEMVAQGMRTDTFGNVNVVTFKSLDEALAHVRSQL